VAAAAKAGRFAAAPEGDGGARMEPSYIKEVIRSEFLPMAKHCYGELLARKKAATGTMRMTFTIVADEKLGGIVEDASVEHDGDGGLGDDTMTTCMRESLSTLAFTPPEHGGTVTVRYPVTFAHDDDDGGPPGGPVTPRP
jgi:hypothetical protein